MSFNVVSILGISITSSVAVFFIWLHYAFKYVENSFLERQVFSRYKKFKFPFEDRVEKWLKYSHVMMSAKQWYGLVIGSIVLFGLFAIFLNQSRIPVILSGFYFLSMIIAYPFQKRKAFEFAVEQDVRKMKQMLAKLYKRNVPLNEMLLIVIDSFEEGIFRGYLKQALERTKTIDTLSDAILWLSDQVQIPSLQFLASTLLQGSRYSNLPIAEKLQDMAKKDRDKLIINFEKMAEKKKMRALIDGGIFIALPLIALLAIVIFYYVFNVYNKSLL